MIVRSCPRGFPLALSSSEVTPMSDAASVMYSAWSKMQKDAMMSVHDVHHSAISAFEK